MLHILHFLAFWSHFLTPKCSKNHTFFDHFWIFRTSHRSISKFRKPFENFEKYHGRCVSNFEICRFLRFQPMRRSATLMDGEAEAAEEFYPGDLHLTIPLSYHVRRFYKPDWAFPYSLSPIRKNYDGTQQIGTQKTPFGDGKTTFGREKTIPRHALVSPTDFNCDLKFLKGWYFGQGGSIAVPPPPPKIIFSGGQVWMNPIFFFDPHQRKNFRVMGVRLSITWPQIDKKKCFFEISHN